MPTIAFNKPYGVLCQFSGDSGPTLADFIRLPDIYPAGRLDRDSEGLLLLTDDGSLQSRIAEPRHQRWKRYLVQVERTPNEEALDRLRGGVTIESRRTLPARVAGATEPDWLWPRDPPVRYRKAIPTAWLEIEIQEGRNRQVRRMTAAVGHPTLRLIRTAIGPINLGKLQPGEWRKLVAAEVSSL